MWSDLISRGFGGPSTAVLCVSSILPLFVAGVARIANQGQRATLTVVVTGAEALQKVADTPLEIGVGNPMVGSVLL